jgi:hypothetical protein
MDVRHPCHIDKHNNTAPATSSTPCVSRKRLEDHAVIFHNRWIQFPHRHSVSLHFCERQNRYDSNVHNLSSKDWSSDFSNPLDLIQSRANTMTISKIALFLSLHGKPYLFCHTAQQHKPTLGTPGYSFCATNKHISVSTPTQQCGAIWSFQISLGIIPV